MGKNLAKTETTFLFCDGGSCQKAGGEQVIREARAYLRNQGLWERTHTIKTRCNGRCEDAPTCIVYPGNHWYKKLTAEKVTEVVKSHTETNQPITKDLLFSDGWNMVASEDERKIIKPKDFELVQDEELGECYWTKGFSSDQYLYPLFQFIAANNHIGAIRIANEAPVELRELVSLRYEDIFALELFFEGNRNLELMIGNIPSSKPQELVDRKISMTEYFVQIKTGNRGIRFKNKKTKVLGQIDLGSSSDTIWNYCLEVMLGGLHLPTLKDTK